MKKLNDNVIIIGVMLFFCAVTLFCTFAHNYYESTHYNTVAIVDTVADDSVTFVTPTGDIWSVDYIPDVKERDFVRVLFYNNRTTQTITDDIVIHVEKIQ